MIFKRKKNPDAYDPHMPEMVEPARPVRQVEVAEAPSLIARDVVVEGHVVASGELHIDGSVFGSVTARSCVVDVNGFVQGEIHADDVFIRGRVIGPISGKNVSIYQGAEVEGDVFNESISIENGASLYGMVSHQPYRVTTAAATAAPPAPVAQAEVVNLFSAHYRLSEQDNHYSDDASDDAYRPIKVVKPALR